MGNLGCSGFPRGWLFLSGTFSCGCPSATTGVPLFTMWDSEAGPGRLYAAMRAQTVGKHEEDEEKGEGNGDQGEVETALRIKRAKR